MSKRIFEAVLFELYEAAGADREVSEASAALMALLDQCGAARFELEEAANRYANAAMRAAFWQGFEIGRHPERLLLEVIDANSAHGRR